MPMVDLGCLNDLLAFFLVAERAFAFDFALLVVLATSTFCLAVVSFRWSCASMLGRDMMVYNEKLSC